MISGRRLKTLDAASVSGPAIEEPEQSPETILELQVPTEETPLSFPGAKRRP